ncbi:MAG: class I SAM-dependent methyltransferase [Sandaracinaceae bacterium]|nr:class I SAM-dependent methyltransferase [Sandaracinaceae bacterium]
MTPEEAHLYALVHDGAPGDVEFYRTVTADAGRVLELGCGWGRVASQLACGEVVGLESDPGMRAVGASRGFTPVEGDMRSFDLGTFDFVIIPFTGIYCLLSEDDLLACLRSVRAALAPEGRLVFDAYAADRFHEDSLPEDYPDDLLELVAEIEHAGEPLLVYERSTWDKDAQRVDAHYVYEREHGGEVIAEIEIGHRYLLSETLEPLLARAGLSLLAMRGSFDGEPFDTETSGSLVVVACRDDAGALEA